MLISVPNVSEGRDQAEAGHHRRRRSSPCTGPATPTTTARCSRSSAEPGELHTQVLAGAREAIERVDLTHHRGLHPARGRGRRRADRLPRPEPTRARRAPRRSCSPTSSGSSASPSTSTASSAGGRTRAELRRPGGLAALHPDFGPQTLHPTAGATLVAARPPLVAFNVEIDAPLETAKAIAQRLRDRARRARARPPAHRPPSRSPRTSRTTRASTAAEVVAAVREHATVTGAELVAPAPRAAHADFPRRRPAPRPGTARRSSNLVGPHGPDEAQEADASTAAMPPARSRRAAAPAASPPPKSRSSPLGRRARERRLTKPPSVEQRRAEGAGHGGPAVRPDADRDPGRRHERPAGHLPRRDGDGDLHAARVHDRPAGSTTRTCAKSQQKKT